LDVTPYGSFRTDVSAGLIASIIKEERIRELGTTSAVTVDGLVIEAI
jgi:hypothetical protein